MPRSSNGSKTGRRRKKLVVDVDPRLADMPLAAVICRGGGHEGQWLPPGAARREELAEVGQTERIRRCVKCGYTVTQVIDVEEKVVISSGTPDYPEGYLIPRKYAGQGRIPRIDAFLAALARQGFL